MHDLTLTPLTGLPAGRGAYPEQWERTPDTLTPGTILQGEETEPETDISHWTQLEMQSFIGRPM